MTTVVELNLAYADLMDELSAAYQAQVTRTAGEQNIFDRKGADMKAEIAGQEKVRDEQVAALENHIATLQARIAEHKQQCVEAVADRQKRADDAFASYDRAATLMVQAFQLLSHLKKTVGFPPKRDGAPIKPRQIGDLIAAAKTFLPAGYVTTEIAPGGGWTSLARDLIGVRNA